MIKKNQLLFMTLKSCGMLTVWSRITKDETLPLDSQQCCCLFPPSTKGNRGTGQIQTFSRSRWLGGRKESERRYTLILMPLPLATVLTQQAALLTLLLHLQQTY